MKTRARCFRPSLSSGWRPATIWDVSTGTQTPLGSLLDELAEYHVTWRILDWWRFHGYLGRYGSGSGVRYPWEEVVDQARWLARLHEAGIRITDGLARLGVEARALGAEYVYSVHGDDKQWVAASAEEIGRLVNEGVGVTAVRVSG